MAQLVDTRHSALNALLYDSSTQYEQAVAAIQRQYQLTTVEDAVNKIIDDPIAGDRFMTLFLEPLMLSITERLQQRLQNYQIALKADIQAFFALGQREIPDKIARTQMTLSRIKYLLKKLSTELQLTPIDYVDTLNKMAEAQNKSTYDLLTIIEAANDNDKTNIMDFYQLLVGEKRTN